MTRRTLLMTLVACSVALTPTAGPHAVAEDAPRERFPDNRTIDTFSYSYSPELFGPSMVFSVTREGKIHYSYASQPHTGSGGRTVVKEWDVPPEEAAALLQGIVDDGLLELKDSGQNFPSHSFSVTYGRWLLAGRAKEMPEPIMKRLLPYLRTAHPDNWKETE
jgi:hypothetical protein